MNKLREILNQIQTLIELRGAATEPELKSLWNNLSAAITELESKLSQPILTDEEIKTEAAKYAIERHGLGEGWQPDREESALGFIEGAKFYRGEQIGG